MSDTDHSSSANTYAMKFSTTKKCATEFLVIGIGLFLLCLTLFFVFPGIYKSQLYKQMALVEGSTSYPMWQDIPLPIYERLYFFNITNAEEFLKYGAKLKVKQVGPYTYKSNWVKDPVAWNPNGTVSYKEIRTYHFLPNQSLGSEDDIIMSLNGPMTTAANILKDLILPFKLAGSFFLGLEGEKVIIQRTIRELAYGGYNDHSIEVASFIIPDLEIYRSGIFCWMYDKNDTDDGIFTVFTGQKDIRLLNVIDKWNGAGNLGLWKGDTCNMFNGSSGEMGPPLEDNQQKYTFFQSIFCRSLTFSYSGEETQKGIQSKRFQATYEVFANRTDNPDNFCFQTSEFMPSGVQDVSSCQHRAPVFISFPHFYLADPVYLDIIDGLNPQKESHLSYIDVEPTTGLSVALKIRFQINLRLQRIPGLLQFQHVPEGIFPVFWVEIDASLTDDLAKFLMKHLEQPKAIFYSLVGIIMAISAAMIIASAVVLARLPRQTKDDDDDDPLLNPDNSKCSVRNGKLCEEKYEPGGAEANYNGSFGDSLAVSSRSKKDVAGFATFENDAQLLDAAGTSEQPHDHSQAVRGGGQ